MYIPDNASQTGNTEEGTKQRKMIKQRRLVKLFLGKFIFFINQAPGQDSWLAVLWIKMNLREQSQYSATLIEPHWQIKDFLHG